MFGLGLFLGSIPFLITAMILAGRTRKNLFTIADDLLDSEEKVLLGQALTMQGLGETLKKEMDIIMGKNVDQEDRQDVDPLGPRNRPESPGWRPGDQNG